MADVFAAACLQYPFILMYIIFVSILCYQAHWCIFMSTRGFTLAIQTMLVFMVEISDIIGFSFVSG